MQLVFDIFDYLFGEEVVNSLRIAEVIFLLLEIKKSSFKHSFPVGINPLPPHAHWPSTGARFPCPNGPTERNTP